VSSQNLKVGADSYVDQNRADENYEDAERLKLSNSGGLKYGFLFLGGLPISEGRIQSAKLHLFAATGWSSATTITARRITAPWKAGNLTYNRQPAVTNANAASLAAGTPSPGDELIIDITAMIADVLAGAKWYGLRLEVNTALRYLHATQSRTGDWRPFIELDWSRKPEGPVNLSPAGGRDVNQAKPTLTWKYHHPDGDAQDKFQVQISTNNTFTAIVHDSGWISDTDEEYNLTPSVFALTDGVTYYWRVRVQNTAGDTSDYSDVATFVRTSKGAFTISSPGATVEETTPPITTTLAKAQESIEYILFLEDSDAQSGWREIWRKRRHDAPSNAGVAYSENIPKGYLKHESRDYKLRVRAWDTRQREATPGDPAYYQVEQVFSFADSAVPAKVDTLTVSPEADGGPGLVLTWTRSIQPDYFAIRATPQGGEAILIEDRLDPVDVSIGGTSYRYTWYGALPGVSYTFTVIAVVNDAGKLKHSRGNPSVDATMQQKGIWLMEIDTGSKVRLIGDDPADIGIGESATTYYPLGRQDPVKIRDSVRGFEGSVTGLIDFKDGPNYRDRFEKWIGKGTDVKLRLMLSNLNIPVELSDYKLGPNPNPGKDPIWNAGFSFVQVDEFDINPPK
jgi:hypothetical protein